MFSHRGRTRRGGVVISVVFALSILMTIPTPAAGVGSTVSQPEAVMAELWEMPDDLATRDLFDGPWGAASAPDPDASYTFLRKKGQGTNPGVTVRDPLGREWHVKQPPRGNQGAEGPVEVVLSRVLSAVGYHQPPVYFLPSFTMVDGSGTLTEPGGRFRLQEKSLKDEGTWSWQRNPFVGTKPYAGLLAILMLFDSSDLKDANNSVYDLTHPGNDVTRWFVVRDLGTALGATGRIAPKRDDPNLFERNAFIRGVKDGFVDFDYHGLHQGLIRRRITAADVAWGCALLAGLTDRQWADAFRAGGYDPAVADRFIRRIHEKIEAGLRLPSQVGR